MSSLASNPLMPNLAVKPSFIDRTHYSGPSSGTVHHSHSSKSGKHSIALTALTLLAFLFFLNILQNCLQEHMDEMNPQIVIMQARIKENRQIEAQKRKGETEISNSSKESRENSGESKTKYMTQIPVSLRTSEKAVKP